MQSTVDTVRPTTTSRKRLARFARALTATSVMTSAVVHLDLWAGGMSQVDVIGPAFLLNAIGGMIIAVAVLAWRHWLPLLAAIGFGAATLGAFAMSMTVGFFGVAGQVWGVPQVLAAVSEVLAIVFAIVALAAERRDASAGATSQASTTQASTT